MTLATTRQDPIEWAMSELKKRGLLLSDESRRRIDGLSPSGRGFGLLGPKYPQKPRKLGDFLIRSVDNDPRLRFIGFIYTKTNEWVLRYHSQNYTDMFLNFKFELKEKYNKVIRLELVNIPRLFFEKLDYQSNTAVPPTQGIKAFPRK